MNQENKVEHKINVNNVPTIVNIKGSCLLKEFIWGKESNLKKFIDKNPTNIDKNPNNIKLKFK